MRNACSPCSSSVRGLNGGSPQFCPVGPEQVGRRAHGDALEKPVRPCPQLGAARVDADGEIAVEADGHPTIERALLCRRELPVGEPLQPGVEGDLLRVLRLVCLHRVAVDVAVGLRPVADPVLAFGGKLLRQRLEGRVQLEWRAKLGAIGEEFGVRRIAEARPVPRKNVVLHVPRGRVLDEAGGAQPIELGSGLRRVHEPRRGARREIGEHGRVDIDRIDEQPRRRRIGRDLRPVRRK